jgi:hypothetical protein
MTMSTFPSVYRLMFVSSNPHKIPRPGRQVKRRRAFPPLMSCFSPASRYNGDIGPGLRPLSTAIHYESRTGTMRLKDEQISRLAEKVMEDMTKADLIYLKKERGAALSAIKAAIAADIKGEEVLERDAEKLLDQNLAAMGGGAGIDRQKMLKMIKEKLARDRKIVL